MFSVDDQERFFRNKQRIHSYKQSGKWQTPPQLFRFSVLRFANYFLWWLAVCKINRKLKFVFLRPLVKQAEIERDNQKLLKKLVEISAGKK